MTRHRESDGASERAREWQRDAMEKEKWRKNTHELHPHLCEHWYILLLETLAFASAHTICGVQFIWIYKRAERGKIPWLLDKVTNASSIFCYFIATYLIDIDFISLSLTVSNLYLLHTYTHHFCLQLHILKSSV